MELSDIFNITTNKQNVICPPDQVYKRRDFDFLLTVGGGLVDNEDEYNRLRTTLRNIGETEFYIHENLGATGTDRSEPFRITIKLTDDYKRFQEKIKAFETPFGSFINHFFVYGQDINWGIYIAEFPTINIIGCDKQFSNIFRQTFSIRENGYADLKEFIAKEFQTNPEPLQKLITNYNLEHWPR